MVPWMAREIGGWVCKADYDAFGERARRLGISAGALLSLVIVRAMRLDPNDALGGLVIPRVKGVERGRITSRPTDPSITEDFKAWALLAGLKPNSAAKILLSIEARAGAVEKTLVNVESS
jgi:hypothetical protein